MWVFTDEAALGFANKETDDLPGGVKDGAAD
jgi:hypothetical protein